MLPRFIQLMPPALATDDDAVAAAIFMPPPSHVLSCCHAAACAPLRCYDAVAADAIRLQLRKHCRPLLALLLRFRFFALLLRYSRHIFFFMLDACRQFTPMIRFSATATLPLFFR